MTCGKFSIKDFGAAGNGKQNDRNAFVRAFSAGPHVFVPPGNYACYEIIEIGTEQTLELAGGATVFRPAIANSTDPVVWIKGRHCGVFGAGQSQSIIRSEKRAPKGVVRLGHKDMTESHNNVTYNTLRDLQISGSKPYGQTSGDPDVALYMPNPQFINSQSPDVPLASYFHNINGLKLENANYGIWLHGWANGNTISNIQGYRIGNIKSGHNAFIFDNGAMENAISNCFFHKSPDSIGLYIAPFDNTAVKGGHIHRNYASSYRGLIFEQGGPSAKGLVSRSSTYSFFEIRHNVAGGNDVEDGFFETNYFFGLGSSHQGRTMNDGEFIHNTPVNILRGTFRTALVLVTYEGDDNKNFTRSDLLLLSVRPSNFSPSTVSIVSTAQTRTGTPGEITNASYSLVADPNTLDASLTVTVTRGNHRGGHFTAVELHNEVI